MSVNGALPQTAAAAAAAAQAIIGVLLGSFIFICHLHQELALRLVCNQPQL